LDVGRVEGWKLYQVPKLGTKTKSWM